MKYIIGIDSGATKSEVIIYNPRLVSQLSKGRKIKVAGFKILNFPAINFNVLGFDESAKRLTDIIKKVSGKVGLENIVFICAGISGARFEKDREKLERVVSKAIKFRNIKIYPDIEIAFASILEPNERNCGILIAGTGSILYYKDGKGMMKKAGGWGRHIGDEGSGYWIAKEALRRVTHHYDKRGKYTSILKAIENKFGISDKSIVKHVYHKGFEISKITPLVFECAEKGDKIAKEIIMSAAQSLALHFTALGKANFQIALQGSLFSEEMLLEKYLRKVTKDRYPNITLIKSKESPVWGAIKLGIIHSTINKSR